MKKYVLLLGLALALEGVVPAYAHETAFRSWGARQATCGQLAQRIRRDFAAYRTVRSSGSQHTAVAYLHVGITILPRGSLAVARTSGKSSALQEFRRKQMRTIAQMRRAGCYR